MAKKSHKYQYISKLISISNQDLDRTNDHISSSSIKVMIHYLKLSLIMKQTMNHQNKKVKPGNFEFSRFDLAKDSRFFK